MSLGVDHFVFGKSWFFRIVLAVFVSVSFTARDLPQEFVEHTAEIESELKDTVELPEVMVVSSSGNLNLRHPRGKFARLYSQRPPIIAASLKNGRKNSGRWLPWQMTRRGHCLPNGLCAPLII